ncbi:MAG TPA: AAA family ATPase, partial [Candidatus Limnocylindrales bacterium]|nr:AAA family ATPase [Candidatus Limnocylindrales bacterium]
MISLPAPPADPPELPAPGEVLKPYVPRLVIDWLRTTPEALHRELEATLVFVDISGFTALTERLAKKGKIGAELMRDTLDGVFRALLDEAYDWGAGLLKWGGDALLLLFDGPEHELRACRAAWEMQRTIDRVGRLHLTGGTLVLRMSVGIGTGTFHFFMTGSVHRELLIAGPAMTETLTMEAIADAGEIGISAALAAKLDRSCVGPPKESTILLAAPPEVDRRRAPDVGDVSSIDIASCIPVATRGHVLLQKSEPEHRTITAAFIDLMDTDRLLEEIGPDDLAVGLDSRIRQIEEAALQYEVPFYETDVGKSSVKALLTAGAPTSTGHDEERMLRTLRLVMDQPGVVPMRIGVNTGRVFTGDFGPSYRRAYRVFGDAINTAARVMSKAEAGQVLSTEIVLSRSRTIFETTAIAPFAAKGKALPVHASIVGSALGRRPADQRGLPLVGRDAELQQVLRAVELTLAGAGTVVEIHGDPGVGKSRLLEEVISRSPTFRLIAARCEEYEASTPYFPMRAVMLSALGADALADDDDALAARLRSVVAAVDPSLEPWIPLLGILLGLELPSTPETRRLDDQFLRERLAEVTIQFLVATLRGPTILAIEDANHIDEATRDLLVRMFEARESHRAMLILTSQSPERVLTVGEDATPLDGDLSLALQPLPAESLTQILELATEDEPLRPHVVEELARRSGGNALFLFELLDAVRESGSLESLPDSIEALIAGEIDRLAPVDRTILRYASVLGASFDPDLLAAVIPDTVELAEGAW